MGGVDDKAVSTALGGEVLEDRILEEREAREELNLDEGARAGKTCGFGDALLRNIRGKGGDAFSMAFELTRIYANSGAGEASHIPALFADLFEMFAFGRDPRDHARLKEGKRKDKERKEKKRSEE